MLLGPLKQKGLTIMLPYNKTLTLEDFMVYLSIYLEKRKCMLKCFWCDKREIIFNLQSLILKNSYFLIFLRSTGTKTTTKSPAITINLTVIQVKTTFNIKNFVEMWSTTKPNQRKKKKKKSRGTKWPILIKRFLLRFDRMTPHISSCGVIQCYFRQTFCALASCVFLFIATSHIRNE